MGIKCSLLHFFKISAKHFYLVSKPQKQGHSAILTLGYPYHYKPYGFLGGKKYNISMPDGQFYQGLLVLPLYPNALKGIEGQAFFSDVFETTPEEIAAFDKNFPYKEKKYRKVKKNTKKQ